MKKIIVLFLFVFSFGALVPSLALADIPPLPSPTPGCSNLFWFDDTNKACETSKQFCGTYSYLGLQTFNSRYECLNATRVFYNFGTVTLRNGSKGEAVMDLQKFLNNFLRSANLVVDGKLGPNTVVSVKEWQKENGLVADGIVGLKTKAKMKEIPQ